MKVLLLGTGMQGHAALHDLAQSAPFARELEPRGITITRMVSESGDAA